MGQVKSRTKLSIESIKREIDNIQSKEDKIQFITILSNNLERRREESIDVSYAEDLKKVTNRVEINKIINFLTSYKQSLENS